MQTRWMSLGTETYRREWYSGTHISCSERHQRAGEHQAGAHKDMREQHCTCVSQQGTTHAAYESPTPKACLQQLCRHPCSVNRCGRNKADRPAPHRPEQSCCAPGADRHSGRSATWQRHLCKADVSACSVSFSMKQVAQLDRRAH